MSRKHGRKYYAVLLNGLSDRATGEYAGLRSYATGFTAKDGYDLRRFSQWSPAQKAKITRYATAVMESRARPHVEVRARNVGNDPKKLRQAKREFNAPGNFPALKVAFVPFATPRNEPMFRPKLHFTDSGIVIQGKGYYKQFIPFDAKSLVKDAGQEVRRVAGLLNNRHITLQCGLHEQGSMDIADNLVKQVRNFMLKYDGKTHIRSKGRKWKAKHHNWRDWLIGLNGYDFIDKNTDDDDQALDVLRDKGAARDVGRKKGAVERRKRRKVIADSEFVENLDKILPGKSIEWRANYMNQLELAGQDHKFALVRRWLIADYKKRHNIT